jgi:hypothetical protein
VPRAELACGRAGDDGDGMAAQLVRPALRLLSGSAACMAASCCICMARGIIPPHVSVVVLAPLACAACHGPCTSRSRREVVRGRDFSCEVETSRGDPSCRELVGDAANWSETGRLASVGLDQGPRSSSS